MLDGQEKKYHLKIRDLPAEEKPREKLLNHGVSCLSTSELLAVIMNTGTKKEGVLEMSGRIAKDYGEGGIMSQKDPLILSKDLGVPIGKSVILVACAELGRRFFQRNYSSLPTIRTAKEVYEYVKDMQNLSKEHLRGIYLNAHYKIIHDEIISIGTVDSSIIHPREVFKPAIEHSAVALILVHVVSMNQTIIIAALAILCSSIASADIVIPGQPYTGHGGAPVPVRPADPAVPQQKHQLFTRTLRVGMTGSDVRSLQSFLNSQGFTIAAAGVGSPGNESTYFGPATARALARFQEAHAQQILTPSGLTRGTGVLGAKTREVVNMYASTE
jgi:DNA repair protein RadC